MTIKELEQELGLDRANIRFYEKEGLIHPARLANGYRDYSQEDLNELRRIRLLRRLGVSIEEIRALQAGTRELSDTLAEREDFLRAQAAAAGRMAALCQRMRSEGRTYAALDAAFWLDTLENNGIGALLPLPEERDKTPYAYFCIFRRAFARLFDLGLCALFVYFMQLSVLQIRQDGRLLLILFLLATAGVMILVEPVLLRFWGYTPGKWLLGLRLRDADGEKLTLWRGVERTAAATALGIFELLALLRGCMYHRGALDRTMDGQYQPWDGDDCYTAAEDHLVLRSVGYGVSFAAVALLISMLPQLLVRR